MYMYSCACHEHSESKEKCIIVALVLCHVVKVAMKRSTARLACAPELDEKGPAPWTKQVALPGEIQLPRPWTAVSDQTGAYFVDVACLALAECRLKGFN